MNRFTGAHIRSVRKANGMTQEQFAEVMKVSVRTLKRWEQTGAGWDKYKFKTRVFQELEQPDLPLESAV